jgi:hypothetical protein
MARPGQVDYREATMAETDAVPGVMPVTRVVGAATFDSSGHAPQFRFGVCGRDPTGCT